MFKLWKYYNFTRALQQLQKHYPWLDKQGLKRLMCDGTLQSFRHKEDQWFLRKQVDSLELKEPKG